MQDLSITKNPLLDAIGEVLNDAELARVLFKVPNINLNCEPKRWIYEIQGLHKLFVPEPLMIELARQIDVMIRSQLEVRLPNSRETNAEIYSLRDILEMPDIPRGMLLTALSGQGKTTTIQRCMSRYRQVTFHDRLPGYLGRVPQVTWISIEMPSGGTMLAFAEALATALADAVGDSRVREQILRPKTAFSQIRSFLTVAKSYFLSAVVVDEIQHLFRPQSLLARRRQKNSSNQLAVKEAAMFDELIRLMNKSGFLWILAGTPDATELLSTRGSLATRLCSGGDWSLGMFESSSDPRLDSLLSRLVIYQHRGHPPLELSQDLKDVVYQFTAGIRRLICNLWQFATSLAVEEDVPLALVHFGRAARTRMLSVQPLVKALITGDRIAMLAFNDILRRD